MDDESVKLVPYDPSWPSLFAAERATLQDTIGPWLLSIEHIGSTSIPNMIAKPIIDIMVGVRSLESSRDAIDCLRKIDYVHFPYKPDVMHWFCKPSPSLRTHHLHLVPIDSVLYRERLAFRDFLRTDPDAFAKYAELKRSLALRFEHDREAYTDAKGPFIRSILSLG